MNNTYHTGDRVLILKKNYTLKHNDIVVFQKENENIIKRCVGLPGETIIIKGGIIFSNNKLIPFPEKAILGNNWDIDSFSMSEIFYTYGTKWTLYDFGEYKIPKKGMRISTTSENLVIYSKIIEEDNSNKTPILKNSYYIFKNNYFFLAGDNRTESVDSRFYGPIKETDIKGKVILDIL